jgi:hypothetical protein
VNIARRWSHHKWSLQAGKHPNVHLQRAWSKYGQPAFVFEVLEQVQSWAVGEQVQREQWWFDQLKPEYNLAPVAFSTHGYQVLPEVRDRLECFEYCFKRGWVFVVEDEYWYAWDAPDCILSVFGITDGESYRSSRPQPDFLLESGPTPGAAPEYVLVGQVPSGDVWRNWD